MTRLLQFVERDAADPIVGVTRAARRPRWIRTIVLIGVAGYLLFCHGCHRGDHDNELFAQLAAWLGR